MNSTLYMLDGVVPCLFNGSPSTQHSQRPTVNLTASAAEKFILPLTVFGDGW
jgi:hypothetical protein